MSIIDGKRKEKTNSQPVEEQTGFSAYAQERINSAKQAYGKSLIGDPSLAESLRNQAADVETPNVSSAASGKAKYDASKNTTPQAPEQQRTFGDVIFSNGAPNLAPDATAGAKFAAWLSKLGQYGAGGNADTTLPTAIQSDVVQAKQNDPERTLEIGRLSEEDRNAFYSKFDSDPIYAKEWAEEKIAETKANEAEAMRAWAKEHPVLGNLASLAPLGATGADIMDVVTDVYAGADHYDPNDPMTPTGISQTMREGAKEGSWFGTSPVGQFVDDVLYSSLQSEWSNVVGGGAFEGTGMSSLPLALYSASAEARSLLQQGYDKREAGILATGYGIISFITEAVGTDMLFKKWFKNTSMGEGFKQFGRRLGAIMLRSVFSEASEEGAEDLGDWIFETVVDLINGTDHSTFSQYKAQYLAAGESDTEATKQAIWQMLGELGLDMLAGGLSGGLMAGANTTFAQTGELARNTYAAEQYGKKGDRSELVANIKNIAKESGSNYADNLQATDSKFLKRFAENLKIGEAMSRANRDIYVKAIQSRLEELGFDYAKSKASAEAIYRDAMGGTLSSQERALVKDEISQRVMDEIENRAGWVYNAYANMSRLETPEVSPATEEKAETAKPVNPEAEVEVTTGETLESVAKDVGVNLDTLTEAYEKRKSDISLNRYTNVVSLASRYGKAGMKMADVVNKLGVSFDNAITEAYQKGQQKYIDELKNKKLRADRSTANVSYMSQEEASKMFGANAVDINSLTNDQKTYVDVMSKVLAPAYGVKIALFDTAGTRSLSNGMFDPSTNTIYIDVNASSGNRRYSMFSAASHEFVHRFVYTNQDVFNALRDLVINRFYNGDEKAFARAVQNMMDTRERQGVPLEDENAAVEEIVAESCEKVFDDPEMIKELAKILDQQKTAQGTLLDKVIAWFNSVIDKIKAALSNLTQNKANRYAEALSVNELEKVRDLFLQAARETQSMENTEGVGNDFTKAEPTDKMNLNTEATQVEKRTGLDGASLPLDGTLKDSDDHANKYSVKSSIEAIGFGYEEYDDNGVKRLRLTYDGEEVYVPTTGMSTQGFLNAYQAKIRDLMDDATDSPLNRMFDQARDDTMSDDEIEQIKDIYATYLATVKLYADDIDMGKEKLDAIWKWAGTETFKVIKANSDKQYKVSADMSSVCVKTEAVLNDISDYQVKSHRGVTPAEVMRIYFYRGKQGYQTPCPFCYVFSHWIRMGQLFQTAASAEDYYRDHLTEKGIRDLDFWKAEYTKQAEWAEKNKIAIQNAKNDILDIPDIVDEFCSLLPAAIAQGNTKVERQIVKTIDTLNERYVQAFNLVAQSDYKGWISSCILKIPTNGGLDAATTYDDYKIVDRDIMFDLRRVDELVREYPAMARFRTSKGSAGGKAVENYADNKFGELIAGVASNADANTVNTLLDDPSKFAKQFERAKQNAKKQMLRGGNRLFSWSDNRQDTGPDMLLNFIQLQAIGAGVQAYTKQIEGLELVAAMGGYINASLVAKGKGYEVIDGKEQLVFSNIQGINADTTFELNKRYDRAGNILVGMNYNHIRIAMADDRIFFIIPWHRSSLSNRLLNRMMELVGEAYIADATADMPTDYTKYQEEVTFAKHLNGSREEAKEVAPSIVNFWKGLEKNNTGLDLGKAIVNGEVVDVKAEGESVSDSQYAYRKLRAKVLGRETLTGVERELVANDYFLSQIQNEMNAVGIDSWGTSDIDFIYPYEYWDHNSTFKTADRNGALYLEYCRRLGVAPKFSGFDKDGNLNEYAKFYDLPGYWKTLPDRRMFDRQGNYQSVTQVKANNFLLDLITNEGLENRKAEYAKIGLKYETSKRADNKRMDEVYNAVSHDMEFYGSKSGMRQLGKFRTQDEDLADYKSLSNGRPIKNYYTERNTMLNKSLARFERELGTTAKTRPDRSEHGAYENATKNSTKEELLDRSPTKQEMQVKWSTRDWFSDPDASAIVSNNPVLLAIEDTIANARNNKSTSKYLMDAYKQNPELDYLSRIQEEGVKGKTAKEFKALIDSINNASLVDDIRYFVPAFRHADLRSNIRDYATSKKAAKYIHDVCDERLEILRDVGGTNLGWKENQSFTVDEIQNLFNNFNTHAELAPLADKVFQLLRPLNIAIIAKTVEYDAKTDYLKNDGYWSGNESLDTDKTGLLLLAPRTFNSKRVTDAYKAEVVLHESIHAVTSYGLYAMASRPWLLKNVDTHAAFSNVEYLIKKLRRILATYAGFPYPSKQGEAIEKPYYGQTDVHEFLAELANPEWRKLLRNVKDATIDAELAREKVCYDWLKASNVEDAALSALDYLLASFDMKDYRTVESQQWVQRAKGEPKYSVKDWSNEELESRYEEAAKEWDETRQRDSWAEAIVREAARRAGAISDEKGNPIKLYHGTPNFGFTKFYDNHLIYATVSSATAGNYGRGKYAGARAIGEPYDDTASVWTDEGIDAIIKNAKNVLGWNYHRATEEDAQNTISRYAPGIKAAADKYVELYDALSPEEVEYYENLTDKFGDWFWNFNRFGYFWKEFGDEFLKGDREAIEWFNTLASMVSNDPDDVRRNGVAQIIDGIDKDSNLAKLLRYIAGFDFGDALIDSRQLSAATFDPDTHLVSYTGLFTNPRDVQNSILYRRDSAAYELYGFANKILEVGTGGRLGWSAIPSDAIVDASARIEFMDWADHNRKIHDVTSTDNLGVFAKQNGYDAVLIRNVSDGGGYADEYIFFSPNQLKSADPVTYDENGNIIPLQERFDLNNKDIRYSIKYDEDGNLKVDGASGFSGGGTIDYMLRDIVSHVFAAEYDADIAAVYEKNNGIHAQRDMLDIKTLEDFKNLPDSLEYAHFSPVCTNFSLANNKRGEAQRDIDFANRIAEMIEAKMPRCITVEQVPAYAKSKSCEIIRKALRKLGYTFDEGIYNSVDFGGDMSRDRFFLRAIKEGELPKIVKTGRTTKGWYDAVKDLIPSLKVSMTSTKAVNKGETKTTNYIPTWMKDRLDAMGVNYKNPSKPLFVMGTGDANGLVRYYPGNEPIGSVKAKVGEPKIILTNGTVLDVDPRVIARLMGIPDDYELPKAKTRAFKILGNGVPGQLSRAMAVPLIEEVIAQETSGQKLSMKEDITPNMYLASAVLNNIRKAEDRAELEKYLADYKTLYFETERLYQEISDLEAKVRDSNALTESDYESIENRIKQIRKDIRTRENKMWEVVSKPRMQRVIEQQRAAIEEYEELMADASEKSEKKIAELRERIDTKVQAEIDKRIAMRKRLLAEAKKQKSRYYYLPRIEKVSKELRENLKRAPMPFRGPIADLLASIDTRALDQNGEIATTRKVKGVEVPHKSNIAKTNLITALKGMERMATDTQKWFEEYNIDVDPNMITWIDEMVEYLTANNRLLANYGDINVNNLSSEMLAGVYKILRSVNTTLKTLTKSYTNKALDISDEAKDVMAYAPIKNKF